MVQDLSNKRESFMGYLLMAYDPCYQLSNYRGFYGKVEPRDLEGKHPLTADDVTGQWLPPEILQAIRAIIPP
jgi:hypothetical protein